ncbi:diaminopimelate decarboxylase [Schinkia azotoformans]|uniref:diaminopimelate decarboxylase n=1 Tax=Schinkia azotoformans TaxID=1454 RepID=UPI002DB74F75|nr:diaminopimelate decarboxylase [Schinkia azotoformans]MEC1723034.1 diaminopimelate decarboxylase [Schinkia azotoformans]MED4352734.1 diaminopimelate decarboxylase [Schinkia azotoformans]MED4414313.1 diaminopimelate decarboxylase [Schinkia azotoformans]
MFFYGTSRINALSHLEIGGVDTVDLAQKYGTPLFVYDVALMRKRARAFKETFDKNQVKAQVAYASKAFSTIAMINLAEEEGLSLDVVSAGELYTALAANFPVERIHFHGNNKSVEEITMGIEAGIGCFVADNFYELQILQQIAKEKGTIVSVLLRISPGVEAHTHDYISTGQIDSKFGFDLKSGQVEKAIKITRNSENLELLGVHSHIGSQIFETTGFLMAVDTIFEAIEKWSNELSYVPKVLNLGGGFGIRYTEEDNPIPPENYVVEIIDKVKSHVKHLQIEMPEIWIEPGRSIVGDAGTTLYSIGSNKEIPDVRKYVAVDGGMGDNLRPALYQAKYEAILANRANDIAEEKVSIAGKCCESGDMLIWDLPLPKANPGDILAVFCTGAYGYSMANNYNRIPRPAVVFVENGDAQLVVKRESYEDIIHLDIPLKSKLKLS